VVIEEDGKTEEEFIDDVSNLSEELAALNSEARTLQEIIAMNLRALVNG
jgi:type I restriction enzyme M protein